MIVDEHGIGVGLVLPHDSTPQINCSDLITPADDAIVA